MLSIYKENLYNKFMDISYKCDLCNKYYINQNNLLNHMNKYHNDNIIENGCKYCNKKLANRYSRWRHEQLNQKV